jgi:ferric-dicitrate binding protein FerR (iron transport regulator)
MDDKYKTYSVEDFAADQDFIRWVKSPDEHTDIRWRRWLRLHPEKQNTVTQARLLVESIEFIPYTGIQNSIDSVWDRINITNSSAQTSKVIPMVPEPASHFHWWRWAAVLTGLLILAGGIFFASRTQSIEYHTAFGQTSKISLPDGSVVTLNANSTLRLGDWESGREVWLEGEAFFSVRKQQTKSKSPVPVKFTVHAGDVDVNVLGTEFTVSDHQTTTVVLNEGKIELKHLDDNIIMNPGDLVEILPGQQKPVKRIVNPEVYSSWKDSEWILDGLTLKEIAKRLEDTFGMKVLIKNNPDPTTTVTGVVPTDSLDKLLTALSAVFELDFKRQGNEIVIE